MPSLNAQTDNAGCLALHYQPPMLEVDQVMLLPNGVSTSRIAYGRTAISPIKGSPRGGK